MTEEDPPEDSRKSIRPKISGLDLLRVMTFDERERARKKEDDEKREKVTKSCQRSMCHSRRSLQLLSVVPLLLLLHLADLSPLLFRLVTDIPTSRLIVIDVNRGKNRKHLEKSRPTRETRSSPDLSILSNASVRF